MYTIHFYAVKILVTKFIYILIVFLSYCVDGKQKKIKVTQWLVHIKCCEIKCLRLFQFCNIYPDTIIISFVKCVWIFYIHHRHTCIIISTEFHHFIFKSIISYILHLFLSSNEMCSNICYHQFCFVFQGNENILFCTIDKYRNIHWNMPFCYFTSFTLNTELF